MAMTDDTADTTSPEPEPADGASKPERTDRLDLLGWVSLNAALATLLVALIWGFRGLFVVALVLTPVVLGALVLISRGR